MGTYCDQKELDLAILSLEKRIAEKNILVSKLKEVPYGVQIKGEGSDGTVGKLTCYFSKKKGLSAVDNSKNSVSALMVSFFYGKENEKKKPFRPSIGSDEAGKGDFFGPLTVAAFFIKDEEMERELLELGIRDSKKISDKKIRSMAREMFRRWPENSVTMAPSVLKYNELYGTIGNLNYLLGWMHGKIILDLHNRCVEKSEPVEAIIIDKFADLSTVLRSNKELSALTITAVTHGEEAEVAIAAASVIARDHFLFKMEKMNAEFDMKIPLGAGPQVKVAGTAFIGRYSRARLKEVAKTHFKTAQQI